MLLPAIFSYNSLFTYTTKPGGRGITVGPIIGDDGFSDIYFVNEGNGGLGNRGNNALFVNDGQGRFTNMAAQMSKALLLVHRSLLL